MRRPVSFLVGTAVALGVVTASPAIAAAAPARPAAVRPLSGPSGCNGDVCMAISNTSGAASVVAWPYNTSFYGYFGLLGPDNSRHASPTRNWGAGDVDNAARFSFNPIPAGTYCVIGWEKSGDGWKKLGEPCVTI